jgi:PAS domain S-box-containing protein
MHGTIRPRSPSGKREGVHGRIVLEADLRRRDQKGSDRGAAFDLLAEKLSRIRYLAEQKTMLDVIEKTPVGICITNEQRLFEYVNPAYCRIYGWTWDELVGRPFTVVVPPELQATMIELHDRFMRQEYELSGEWEVVRKDGRRIHILANAAYVVDERGRPRKITYVVDISARREAEAERDRLAGLLARGAIPS